MNKNLEEKAIDIKGKKYVLVSDRVLYFNDTYPHGSITTEILSDEDKVTIKATITPDCDKPDRRFVGHSQATWGEGFINKTAALENAETSAVGRALALMGIGVIDSIASVDEINKAQTQPAYVHGNGVASYPTKKLEGKDQTELVIANLERILNARTTVTSKDVQKAIDGVERTENLSKEQKEEYLAKLQKKYDNLKEIENITIDDGEETDSSTS